MRQAIEEGFILDVLQNYMTYKAYYELEKAIEDDPELQGRKARRRVACFASLHPTAIGQKVEVIVEHFRRHVQNEIGGRAKAMVVTQSREHALRYYFGVREYLQKQDYTDLKALVAFSGELEVDGESMDGSSGERIFRRPNCRAASTARNTRCLIVAEKYQTGYRPAQAVRNVCGPQACRVAGCSDTVASQPDPARQGPHLCPRLPEH